MLIKEMLHSGNPQETNRMKMFRVISEVLTDGAVRRDAGDRSTLASGVRKWALAQS